MNYYKFGIRNKYKFIAKNDLSKSELRKFYTPTTLISKILFYSNIFKLNKIITKRKYNIDNNVLILLKGNNKIHQKFISLDKNNHVKKWAYTNNKGSKKIIFEYKNINKLNSIPDLSSKFEIPKIIDYDISRNNKIVFIKFEKIFFNSNSSTKTLNIEFINYYFENFSKKYSKQINNKIETLNHGDLTPWNVKQKNKKYIILDWEDMKYGDLYTDIIHYQYTFYFFIKKLDISKIKNQIKNLPKFKENTNYIENVNRYFNE